MSNPSQLQEMGYIAGKIRNHTASADEIRRHREWMQRQIAPAVERVMIDHGPRIRALAARRAKRAAEAQRRALAARPWWQR